MKSIMFINISIRSLQKRICNRDYFEVPLIRKLVGEQQSIDTRFPSSNLWFSVAQPEQKRLLLGIKQYPREPRISGGYKKVPRPGQGSG